MTTPIQGLPADPSALRAALAEHDIREAEAAALAQPPEEKAAAMERIRARLAAANLGPVLEDLSPLDFSDEADNTCDCTHKRPNGCNARCDRT